MTNEELVYLYQNGDRKALAELTEKNKGIVNKLANKFYTERTSSIDKEDLEQEGYIGLMLAADKYDLNNPTKAKFITYATHWIYSKMNRFIRTKNTNEETSLNTPIGEESEDERMDFIEYIDNGYENIEEKLYLQELREDLEKAMLEVTTLQEREVLKLHYGWDCKVCTLTYIGGILDVSSERVRQIENRALRKIRTTKWARNRINERTKGYMANRYNDIESWIISEDYRLKYGKTYINTWNDNFVNKYFSEVM
jgi:RNA polymerase primary sigma factor/RNA polymerase sporulation-specific sigma factor